MKVNSSELNPVLSFGALGKAVFEQERKLAGFVWNRRKLCTTGIVAAGP